MGGLTLRLCLAMSLFGASACAQPRPRTPEAVVQHEAQKKPSRLLDDVSLSPKKRRLVNALVLRMRLHIADYEGARLALLDEAVRGVKVGQLSEKRLRPLLEAALTRFEPAIPYFLKAMDDLHALLNLKERTQFVALLNGERSEKLSKEEKKTVREEQLSRILDLNSGQKTRFFGAMLGITLRHFSLVNGTRNGIEEAKDAFLEEDFQAAELRVVQELDLRGLAVITYEALQAALEILTPEQRHTLAALMVARMR